MPKFPCIPRVTIIVPVGDDLAAFENSLVSVLENLPPDAEVVVPHDGSYDDPFDLTDEVRFVSAPTHQWADLIAVAAAEARGRFVLVIGGGIQATEDWVRAAIEEFDDPQVGLVAPVVRCDRGSIVAAGWQDTPARLCTPLLAAGTAIERQAASRIGGAYLPASLWRRETLRSLSGRYRGEDVVETSYAFGKLVCQDGWRIVLAPACELNYDRASFSWDRSTFERGRRLRAIQQRIHGGGWGAALLAAAKAIFAAPLGRGRIMEAVGQAAAPSLASEYRGRIKLNLAESSTRDRLVPIGSPSSRGLRRAA